MIAACGIRQTENDVCDFRRLYKIESDNKAGRVKEIGNGCHFTQYII